MDKISHEERCFIIKEAAKWYKRLSEAGLQLAESKGLIGPATWAKESEGLARGNSAIAKDYGISVAHHLGGSRKAKALASMGYSDSELNNVSSGIGRTGFAALPFQDLNKPKTVFVGNTRPNSKFTESLDNIGEQLNIGKPSTFSREDRAALKNVLFRHELDEVRSIHRAYRKGKYITGDYQGENVNFPPMYSSHASANVLSREYQNVKGMPPASRAYMQGIRGNSVANEYGDITEGLKNPKLKDLMANGDKTNNEMLSMTLSSGNYMGISRLKKGKPMVKEAAKWYKRLSEEGLQLAESKGLIGPATWAKESEGLARGNANLIKDHNIFVAHHGGGSRLDKALDLSGIPAKYKEDMKGSLNTAGFTSLPPQDLTSTTPITVSSLRPNSAFVKTIDDHLASEKGADPSYFFGNLNRTESLHGGRLMLRHEIDELRTSKEHLRNGNYVSIRPDGVDRAVIPGTSAGNHASAKVVAEELSSVKGAPPALRKAFTNIRSYKNEYGRIEDGLPSPTRKDLLYSASKLDSVDIPNSIQQNLDRYAYQGAKKGKPMIKEAAKWYKRLSEEGLQLAESKGLIGPATWARESEGLARGVIGH